MLEAHLGAPADAGRRPKSGVDLADRVICLASCLGHRFFRLIGLGRGPLLERHTSQLSSLLHLIPLGRTGA